jgi:SAM-dependent methyltransferase
MDPFAQLKEAAKVGWSSFAPTEMITGSAAPRLVRHACIGKGAAVLDVGCGTGVVALTAARLGARVTGADLTPKLLERARENAAIMKLEIEWREADVEALPFPDAQFDVVVSQFGHMFAPRPDVATQEMLRVLKPGGILAFSTWPPELYTGQSFALSAKYGPPPPPGAAPPVQWGDPSIVRQRLGAAVRDIVFDRDAIVFQTLSPAHLRLFMEANVGPIGRLVQSLASDPPKLESFRREMDELTSLYFENNQVRQQYLLTRATKV